jgi:selenocysteine lyase/cysteine desulfurase
LDATIDHLRLESEIGGYEAFDRARANIEQAYEYAARLIGARSDEIALIENATRAWDMAFYSIPFAPGDRILMATAEYASNYISALQVAKRSGAQVEVIPNDQHGQVSVSALAQMLDERVKLVAITHVPNNGGLVNPVEEIGAVIAGRALYLVDACQSVGQIPVDVESIRCDMLSATSRKFLRGPRGAGFLYVRRSALARLEPPFLDLHAARWTARNVYEMRNDARRFENWETSYALRLGFAAALAYALEWGIETISARITSLATQLRAGLAAIAGVQVHDLGTRRCGIVSFSLDGISPVEAVAQLRAQGINLTESPVEYTRIDMEERGLQSLIRASVHYYNSEAELEKLLHAVSMLRK